MTEKEEIEHNKLISSVVSTWRDTGYTPFEQLQIKTRENHQEQKDRLSDIHRGVKARQILNWERV